MRRTILGVAGAAMLATTAGADPLMCDLAGVKAQRGLNAVAANDQVTVTWAGAQQQELRASFAVVNAAPVVRELAVRVNDAWRTVATNLTPEFRVVSGIRRMSNQQMQPLRELKVEPLGRFLGRAALHRPATPGRQPAAGGRYRHPARPAASGR
jgi:hypothetical protein